MILRIARGQVPVEAVRERIDGLPAAALVLSGGDTASLVCRAAGVQRIELCDEIVLGSRAAFSAAETSTVFPVVTKSGGFGDRDTLIQCSGLLSCPNRH